MNDKLIQLTPDYEELISLSEEFHCVLDNNKNILMFNQMFFKALGVKPSHLEGVDFSLLLLQEYQSPFDKIWDQTILDQKKQSVQLAMNSGKAAINVYWRFKSADTSELVYAVGNVIPDEKESEQTKLAKALHFLNDDLETSKSGDASFALTDIQRVLTEKVDKFKLISQNVSDLVCLHDPTTTRYLYVSPSVKELTGYEPEELVGKSPFDLFHPDFLDKLEQDRQRSGAGENQGPPPKMEVMFQTKDGQSKWIEAHSRPIFDDEGNVMLILSTSRDVSDRKKAEQEKETYFNYYKTLGNNIPNGAIFLIDTNYRFIIAEGEEFDRIGRTSEYYVGKTISEVYDKTRLNFLKPYFERVMRGDHVKFEYPHNGEHYVFHGSPGKDRNGNIVAGVFLTQNITETKQFQDLLKQTIYQLDFQKKALDLSALVSEADKNGILTYVNDRFVEISGYTRDELIGQPYTIMKLGNHAQDYYDDIWESISINEEVWHGEVKSQTKRGDFIWLDTYIVPFKDQSDEVTKYVFIRFDISDRKAIQEKLEVKNFELDSFVYHTSHDLRAPLASILGLTTLIAEEDNVERIKEMNNMIKESVKKQDDFIKSILSYSQNENLPSSIEEIQFEVVIENVLQELSNMPNKSDIDIRLNITGETLFHGDPVRLMIIFKNLIGNAIKYYDSRKESFLSIDINKNSDEAKIVIEDNGVGIRKEHLESIFDMFYRGNESSDGSGLGLYIVKETIDKLGGSISISSDFGKGTKFAFNIPNAIILRVE
ncbi:MAG: PAS domain S-box protein [Bacteroidota bacterium]